MIPIAFRFMLTAPARWSFNISARPRYSSIFARIKSLDLSFFSSIDGCRSDESAGDKEWTFRVTFHCEHEVVQGILVLFIGLRVILLDIFIYCALDDFNGTL